MELDAKLEAMFEELLNRIEDADDGDASSGLTFIKKQALRICQYRVEQTRQKIAEIDGQLGQIRPVPPAPKIEDDIPF